MSVYSIKDLEVISGIKAHTIRIWEQRYSLLEPKRTDTNIRYYDDYQMCKLLNISSLLENGHKVSKIASYTEEEISQQVEELIKNVDSEDSKVNALVNQIISAGLTYDEDSFNDAFNVATNRFGLIDAFSKVIYPMLVRVGLMWNKQDMIPSQEHFISNLVKQKLFAAIEDIPEPKKGAESWLLMLPEEEDHEIGLILSYFLLKSKGKKVFYLGQRVPISSVESFLAHNKLDAIHFFMVRNQTPLKAQKLIDKLSPITKGIKVYLSGSESVISKLNIPNNFTIVNSIENFLSKF